MMAVSLPWMFVTASSQRGSGCACVAATGRRVNADLTVAEVKRFCVVDTETERLLAEAVQARRLSARGYHRVLRVARTAADLAGSDGVRSEDVAFALLLSFRSVIGIGPADPLYPARLLDVRCPPDPLWLDGDSTALETRTVSIVGTRRMTPYGARVARELASACAEVGIVVVSGLAQGVDSAAHEGALDAHGRPVAVLGAGIAAYLADARGRRRRLAYARASVVSASNASSVDESAALRRALFRRAIHPAASLRWACNSGAPARPNCGGCRWVQSPMARRVDAGPIGAKNWRDG